jgi:hypothetical protein
MELKEFVNSYNARVFFHFTDMQNLESIRRYGLLSYSELVRRGIPIPKPGGNEWSRDADQIKGVDAYVHLCFTDDHPMEYLARRDGHIGDVRYLQIKPEVILEGGVMGSKKVANASDAVIKPIEEALAEIDVESILLGKGNCQDWKKYLEARKSEILIPTQVNSKYILNL